MPSGSRSLIGRGRAMDDSATHPGSPVGISVRLVEKKDDAGVSVTVRWRCETPSPAPASSTESALASAASHGSSSSRSSTSTPKQSAASHCRSSSRSPAREREMLSSQNKASERPTSPSAPHKSRDNGHPPPPPPGSSHRPQRFHLPHAPQLNHSPAAESRCRKSAHSASYYVGHKVSETFPVRSLKSVESSSNILDEDEFTEREDRRRHSQRLYGQISVSRVCACCVTCCC